MSKHILLLLAEVCPDCDSNNIFLEHYTDFANVDNGNTITVKSFITQRCLDCGNEIGRLPVGIFLDRINTELLDNSDTYKRLPTDGKEF